MRAIDDATFASRPAPGGRRVHLRPADRQSALLSRRCRRRRSGRRGAGAVRGLVWRRESSLVGNHRIGGGDRLSDGVSGRLSVTLGGSR